MAVAAGAIISKVRSMYGEHLNERDYSELLRKRSVGEIAGYLKQETHYREALRNVRENNVHRGQLEDILRKDLFRELVRLYRYADSKDEAYYHLFIEEVEIDVILHILRMLISGRIQDAIAELPVFMHEYFSYDLMKMGTVRSYDDLLDVVEKTYYHKVLLPFRVNKGREDNIDYAGCEAALIRAYYDRLIREVQRSMSGVLRKDLLEMHTLDIELNNLAKIYRFKRYYNVSQEVVMESLVPVEGRLRKSTIMEMVNAADDQTFQKLLAQSRYHLRFEEEDNIDIEWYMDNIRYQNARRKLYYSQKAPVVFSAYAVLQKNELTNIIRIIEGVRYQVDSDTIASMLIY